VDVKHAVAGSTNGVLGAINIAKRSADQLARASLRSETTRVRGTRKNVGTSGITSPAAAEISDIRYVSGLEGRRSKEVLGPGECCADDPRGAGAGGRRSRAAAAAPTDQLRRRQRMRPRSRRRGRRTAVEG